MMIILINVHAYVININCKCIESKIKWILIHKCIIHKFVFRWLKMFLTVINVSTYVIYVFIHKVYIDVKMIFMSPNKCFFLVFNLL